MAAKRPKVGWRRKLLSAGLLVAILRIFSPQASSAEINDCGSLGNRFDGYATYPTGVPASAIKGSAATLLVRFGAVCNTDQSQNPFPSNFSTAWVMVADNLGGPGYSQSGHFRWYGSAIYPFAETNPGSGFSRVIDYARPITPGTAHTAKTGFTTSCAAVPACFKNYWDGQFLSQSLFNPNTQFTFPFSAQFFGETTYAESDVPGSATAPEVFGGVQTQNHFSNAWASGFGAGPLAAPNSVPSRYAKSGVAYGGFNIWTF